MGDVAAGILLSLVLSILVSSVVYSVVGSDAFDDLELWATALLQVPLWLALVGVPVVATRLKGRRSLARDFGFTMRWSDIPLGLGLGLGLQIALGIVLQLVYPLLGIDLDRVGDSAQDLADRATSGAGVVLVLLIAAVGAPIVEELFYRGLFLRSVQRRFGDGAAVVVPAVVFGFLPLPALRPARARALRHRGRRARAAPGPAGHGDLDPRRLQPHRPPEPPVPLSGCRRARRRCDRLASFAGFAQVRGVSVPMTRPCPRPLPPPSAAVARRR
jgi:membrane protease YdiL (CAAX protease family)